MAPTIERISPAEARRRMDEEGYLYLDVRTEAEFACGHPVGAVNVPLQAPDFLPLVEALWPRGTKIVVGCATGRRSMVAAGALLEAGFPEVVEQRAGMDGARGPFGELREPGWAAAGLPVTTEGGSLAELRARAGR